MLLFFVSLSDLKFNPEIWINGLGQIVESKVSPELDNLEANDTASNPSKDDAGFWHVETLHRHDLLYCGENLHLHCRFPGPKQFLPFRQSMNGLSDFLYWVLERGNHLQSDREG